VPIEVNCDKCGKSLKAPDSMAGKKAKCPACAAVLTVPQNEEILDAEIVEPEYEAPQEQPYAGLGDLLDEENSYRVAEPDPPAGGSAGEDRHPCPACGEMIVRGAARCRFCNEIFDPALKRRSAAKRGSFGLTETDDNPNVVEWLVAIFCGLIGIIIALVYIAQGKKKGYKMLALTAVLFVIFFMIGFVGALLEQAGR